MKENTEIKKKMVKGKKQQNVKSKKKILEKQKRKRKNK